MTEEVTWNKQPDYFFTRELSFQVCLKTLVLNQGCLHRAKSLSPTVSRDNFIGQNKDLEASGITVTEARDAACHPVRYKPAPQQRSTHPEGWQYRGGEIAVRLGENGPWRP